jgi:hypothetical protein
MSIEIGMVKGYHIMHHQQNGRNGPPCIIQTKVESCAVISIAIILLVVLFDDNNGHVALLYVLMRRMLYGHPFRRFPFIYFTIDFK